MKKALRPSFKMADEAVQKLGNAVKTALTNNDFFPTPSPTLAELQTLITAYSASLADAQYGSRAQRGKKNADKKALITALRDEADYVNMIAKGDVEMLSTTAFPLSKDRAPIALGTPVVKVENGVSGELISSTPACSGARMYKHKYKKSADTEWKEIVTSKATCKIGGLAVGTSYNFCIDALGTKDQSTTSDVVTKVAA
jgi:hypothetical protein